MWGFSGDAIVFCDDIPIGPCEAVVTWAANNWGFQDSRPLAFYEALAKDAYNAYIARKEVILDLCVVCVCVCVCVSMHPPPAPNFITKGNFM